MLTIKRPHIDPTAVNSLYQSDIDSSRPFLKAKKTLQIRSVLLCNTNEFIRCLLCEGEHPFVGTELRYLLRQNVI